MDSVLNPSIFFPLSSWSFFPLKMVGSTSFLWFSHENLGVIRNLQMAFFLWHVELQKTFFLVVGLPCLRGRNPRCGFLSHSPNGILHIHLDFWNFPGGCAKKTLSFARGLSECNPGFFYSRMTRRCMPCQILVTFSVHTAKPRRNGKRQFLQENAIKWWGSSCSCSICGGPTLSFTDLFFPDCRGVMNSEIPNIFTGKSIKHDSMISSRSSALPPPRKKNNTKGH